VQNQGGWDGRDVKQKIRNKILVGKTQTKRHLGRSRHRWDNNIKINPAGLQE
jgi:hypothetical protein